MDAPVIEVVSRYRGNVTVARVLLYMHTIVYRYPRFGVWCYLIRSGKNVVVFDAGPRFGSLFGGKWGKDVGNTSRILTALDRYFPGIPVSYIAASHYHFDHVENAPYLQQQLAGRQRSMPPIRVHARELEPKRFLHLFPHSLVGVLKSAGYKTWKMGKPIRDGESIPGSSYRFIHCPGHTSGNLALRSDTEKVVIGGYWAVPQKKVGLVARLVTSFVDEATADFSKTKRMLRGSETYRIVCYHPTLRD
jgi:glyoxylase-like metal-dependent hydrolase (beta-lactamase superfamily II)